MKTLVVYYSLTGNTRLIAEAAARELGAEIEELRELKRRSGIKGFVVGGLDSLRKKSVEIEPCRHRIEEFELVVVGTPVWGWGMTPAVRTYLTGRSWKGKKTALFCTMGGSGQRRTLEGMAVLVSGARVVGQEAFSRVDRNPEGNLARLKEWLSKLDCGDGASS